MQAIELNHSVYFKMNKSEAICLNKDSQNVVVKYTLKWNKVGWYIDIAFKSYHPVKDHFCDWNVYWFERPFSLTN